ncbi:APC family permease [Silvibacterium acidisoli]|uniref:APC family permease n=1 Tax=Acidobacteriaceae bacterium ZG23-2 TaxID=2883246 RepID=UPI00406C40EF
MADAPSSEHGLSRQLGLRDLVLTQIVTVVGSSWVGVAAGLGRAETLMWVAAMLVFYVPMAGSVIGLNRAMPHEGGLYVWAHRAFGDLGGFLVAWNLWVYGMAVTATILYAIPTEIAYMVGAKAAWLPENRPVSVSIVVAVVLLVALAAARGLALGKWIHNAGGIAMLIAFGVLILLPLWAVLHGEHITWTPFSFAMPSMNLRSLALFGQMLFGALCGLEYLSILAGEARNPDRNIGLSVWISSPVICAMFILGTASVIAFIPHGRIDFIAPIPQTMRASLGQSGFGNLLATVVIVLIELRLIAATSFLFTGLSRLPMTVGWDSLLPPWFSRLHRRWKTPTNSILCTAAIISLMIVLANVGVHAQEAFQVLSNASLAHYQLAYTAMFAIPLIGSATLRKELPGWLTVTSVVGLLATLFSLTISVYPIVDVVNPRLYATKILGTTAISNVIGLVFYRVRNRRRFGG